MCIDEGCNFKADTLEELVDHAMKEHSEMATKLRVLMERRKSEK